MEMNRPDKFGVWLAVLIALLSLSSALIAWRVADASGAASDADAEGLLAAVDAEDAKTAAKISVLSNLTVYARAVQHETLKKHLDALAARTTDAELKAQLEAQSKLLDSAATRDRDFLPAQYIDRNNVYDVARDYGETLAVNARRQDVLPEPHFTLADRYRAKAEFLLGILVALGAAFVLLTLADAIRTPLRYFMLTGGIVILVIGSGSALLIELWYAFALS